MNKTDESMAIHTFAWGMQVSKDIYFNLFRILIRNRTPYQTESYKKYTTYDYHSLGINRIEFTDYNHPYYQHLYYINFVINPRIISGSSTELYTRIVEKSQLKTLPDTLETTLANLCGSIENMLSTGKFRRIDYCCNLWFNSQETVEVYLYLLKQAKIPYRFEVKKYYSSKQKRKITEPYAITVTCKSYELAIYIKYPQLKAKYDRGDLRNVNEVDNSRGQLRIELRERRPKLLSDKKNALLNESELLDGSNTRPRETLCKLLKFMYGIGDFLLYGDAKEEIINSPYKDKVKKRMLDVLEAVKKGRSLDTEKNGLDQDAITKTIPYFNKLGLSPITIPQKKSQYCDEVFFPNPLKYVTGESVELLRDTDVLQTESFNDTE